jgi:hypothetical protein
MSKLSEGIRRMMRYIFIAPAIILLLCPTPSISGDYVKLGCEVAQGKFDWMVASIHYDNEKVKIRDDIKKTPEYYAEIDRAYAGIEEARQSAYQYAIILQECRAQGLIK